MASSALYLRPGLMVTVVFTTMGFAAMYQQMGMPAEEAGQVGTMVEQMRGVSLASGIAGLVVLGRLYATEYVFLPEGADWPRIVGIVLAVLSSLTFLGNLSGFWLYGQWAIVLNAIGMVFIAVNIAWLRTAFHATPPRMIHSAALSTALALDRGRWPVRGSGGDGAVVGEEARDRRSRLRRFRGQYRPRRMIVAVTGTGLET